MQWILSVWCRLAKQFLVLIRLVIWCVQGPCALIEVEPERAAWKYQLVNSGILCALLWPLCNNTTIWLLLPLCALRYLQNNPLLCDCRMEWYAEFMKLYEERATMSSSSLYNYKHFQFDGAFPREEWPVMPEKDDLFCAGPDDFMNYALTRLEMNCDGRQERQPTAPSLPVAAAVFCERDEDGIVRCPGRPGRATDTPDRRESYEVQSPESAAEAGADHRHSWTDAPTSSGAQVTCSEARLLALLILSSVLAILMSWLATSPTVAENLWAICHSLFSLCFRCGSWYSCWEELSLSRCRKQITVTGILPWFGTSCARV